MAELIKYKWVVTLGFSGADYEGEWEFEYEPTEEELDELLQEEISNYSCSFYERIEG